MFGIGMPEMIIVLVIVLIVFGAGKLPEIGAGIGNAIKNFKKAAIEKSDEETREIEDKSDQQK
jgi:sec-independent protein translocase protein TatA